MSEYRYPTLEQQRQLVRQWKETGLILQRLRAKELQSIDVAKAIELLDGTVAVALRLNPPRPTSGLVEQQAIFARYRK